METWTKATLPTKTNALSLGTDAAIASGEQPRIWKRIDAFLVARANRTGREQVFAADNGMTLALVLPGDRRR
jgi:hypothetical protein